MLNPLVIAGARQDPTKTLRPGIAVAISTCALLARIGIASAPHDTIAKAMIAHWLCGLMIFVFWAAAIVSALERYTDVVERNSELGLLRVLGASNSYLLMLLIQEALVFAAPGALCGLGLAYFTRAILRVVSGSLIAFQIPLLWWPAAAVFASVGSIMGAILALPRAIAEGVRQTL